MRDCKHGRQLGKCPECDVADLETENQLLRAHIKRLQQQIDLHIAAHKITAKQRDEAQAQLTELAERVAKRLEQAGAVMQAGLIREVFISKIHP